MISLKDISRLGSLPQCSFSNILCVDCGIQPGLLRSGRGSIGFIVCDECFKRWVFYSVPQGDFWGVYLVVPFRVLALSSVDLNDAIECLIDFADIRDDKTWSRNWIKTHLKRLLRVGERNF